MRNSNYLKVILYVVLALSLFSGLVMTAVGIMAGLFTHKIGSVNGNDDYAYVLILGTFMAAIGVGMITRASLFIAFISKRDMEELQQNRWALIVLALGISSFWIPFILRRTTGYGVSSTSDVPVKYYLGKWFSMIWFVSAIAFVCAFLFVSSYQIGDEGGLISFGTTGYLNDFVYSTAKMQSLNNGIFYALIGITAFQLFIGILAVPAFYFPNSLESYQNGGAFKVYMLIFGWFFTMWATVLLVFAILSAFLEIGQCFRKCLWQQSRRNGIAYFFNHCLTIYYCNARLHYYGCDKQSKEFDHVLTKYHTIHTAEWKLWTAEQLLILDFRRKYYGKK
jgi:hypothetical protein